MSWYLERLFSRILDKNSFIIYHVLGFTLLTTGILLLILVLIGFSNRGLV